MSSITRPLAAATVVMGVVLTGATVAAPTAVASQKTYCGITAEWGAATTYKGPQGLKFTFRGANLDKNTVVYCLVVTRDPKKAVKGTYIAPVVVGIPGKYTGGNRIERPVSFRRGEHRKVNAELFEFKKDGTTVKRLWRSPTNTVG